MNAVRVLVVDDHTLFRSGLTLLLQRQPGFEVVGEAGDGLEGVKRAKQLRPDVVLLDLHMPGMGGLDALGVLREEVPDTEVIMLTVSEDSEDLLAALRAGARGYVLKNSETDFLLDAVRRAAGGESVLSPRMAAALADSLRSPAPPAAEAPRDTGRLTPRERQILALLARGGSNKEIARSLEVAESTVKIHVQAILRKLGLQSRVQAAVYAIEHGLAGEAAP